MYDVSRGMHFLYQASNKPGFKIKKPMHMTTKPTFWQRTGVQSWFLKKETGFTETASLTPDLVYKYIIEKFRESVAELSFADRVIFYHEYIICFSPRITINSWTITGEYFR